MRDVFLRILIVFAAFVSLSLFIFYDAEYSYHPLLPMSVRIWVYSMMMPKPLPPPHWTLRHEIKTADQVAIRTTDGHANLGLPYLDHQHNEIMLALLRKSDHFQSARPQLQSDLIFDVLKSAGHDNVYVTAQPDCPEYHYDIETGALGQGNEWCYVPPEFREWMKKVLANPPKVIYDSGGRMKDANDAAKSPP